MWIKSRKGFGIAICNFSKGDIPFAIDLWVCDTVVILEECEGWYRGHLLHDKSVKGIFPSSFVHIRSPFNNRVTKGGNVLDEKIIEEITHTLREWGNVLKNQFYALGKEVMLYQAVRKVMHDLIGLRREFMMVELPREMKIQLKTKITQKLDWGNSKLELDLVPRISGNQVDLDVLSPIQLFKIHEGTKITRPINRQNTQKTNKASTLLSHQLYLKLSRFECPDLVYEDTNIEIYFALYEANTGSFITERVLCKFDKDRRVQSNENAFSTMFVDLTSEDLSKDVFLVAHVYKYRGLGAKEKKLSKHTIAYKRPYGCAVLAIHDVLQGDLNLKSDKVYNMPLFLVGNNENDFPNLVDTIIKKVKDKKIVETNYKDVVQVVLNMLHGDIASIKQQHPLLFTRRLIITSKIGFADVIAPDLARNDLYLNMLKGEFEKAGKTAEKNVELRALIIGSQGEIITDCIWAASGEKSQDEYKSTVFYHNNSPKWNEVIRVTLPHQVFSTCHLRLEFRHCSRTAGEKKLFAFSYLPLVDHLGMTVQDKQHELIIYKVLQGDLRRSSPIQDFNKLSKPHYLSLASESSTQGRPTSNQFCTISAKETCSVQTTLCSTQLTQDVNMLTFFKWRDNLSTVNTSLENLRQVKGDELMRFHNHVLNNLFSMSCDKEASQHQALIFKALVHVLKFPKENNFAQFMPLIEEYIEKTFCAPLAHRDMLAQLRKVIEDKQNSSFVAEVIDVLDLLFKFIVQSAVLYAKEQKVDNHYILVNGMEEFWQAIRQVVRSSHSLTDSKIKYMQAELVESIVDIFPELLKVFEASKLAEDFKVIIERMPKRDSVLSTHKLRCLSKVINSELFEHEDAKLILLDLCNSQVKFCFQNNQDVKTAAENLSDVLIAIHEKNSDGEQRLLANVVSHLMDVVMTTILAVKEERKQNPANTETAGTLGRLVACLMTMFSKMDENLFKIILDQQNQESGSLRDFLLRVFRILTDVVYESFIPKDWCVMIMVINSIILSSIQYFSQALTDHFLVKFDHVLWSSFFVLGVKFITQPCLQLENFSVAKQSALRERYNDMRLNMGHLLLDMWESLEDRRLVFIPELIGPFLDATLIPEPDLRHTLLPVFFDMMQCEHKEYGHFHSVEAELIDKLDIKINEKKGDESFRLMFQTILLEKSNKHPTLKDQGSAFINSVSSLLERLLDYRDVLQKPDNIDLHIICTVNLLDFYQNTIKRDQLYTRYIHKLCTLHKESNNHTEAGLTLLLSAKKLDWTSVELPGDTSSPSQIEWKRKEFLYNLCINYLDRGKSWENAIPLCKELAEFYENRLFDFDKLARILTLQAEMVSKILTEQRCARTYFKIGFFGTKFPAFIRNKVYIHRGKAFEHLSDLTKLLMSCYPSAELHKNPYEIPEEDILKGSRQYIQVLAVKPVVTADYSHSKALGPVHENITEFYKQNAINTFQYDRAYHEGDKDKYNEHKTLWLKRYRVKTAKTLPGILCWSEIVETELETLSPIRHAVDQMMRKNDEIASTIEKTNAKITATTEKGHLPEAIAVQELSRQLKGTIDAAVNGGITLYQEAFLTREYADDHPEDSDVITQLKQCITNQFQLSKEGLELHGRVISSDIMPFHKAMTESYANLKKVMIGIDPDISSLGSGSHCSVLDLTTNSPRVSSGYASSVENNGKCPDDERDGTLRDSHYPSTHSLNDPDSKVQSNSGKSKNDDGSVQERTSGLSRSSSVFYQQIDTPPSLSPEFCMPAQKLPIHHEDLDSDDERNHTLTRDIDLAPPMLPPKQRSNSFSVCSLPFHLPDSPTAKMKNRPLPSLPTEASPNRPAKPALPTRSKTVTHRTKSDYIDATTGGSSHYFTPRSARTPTNPEASTVKSPIHSSSTNALPLLPRRLPPTPAEASIPPPIVPRRKN